MAAGAYRSLRPARFGSAAVTRDVAPAGHTAKASPYERVRVPCQLRN